MDAAPEDELKLFGIWSSPYVHRVQLALKLKGLHYEYVEEDLANKSPSLLRLNPVYKKVPVLLHGDRPIVESVVIVEYIDETWRDRYPLMPTDPRERAAVRFWCHFATDKLGLSFWEVFRTTGEEQRAAVRVALDNLKLLEDELREGLFRGRRFFGGEKMGFLDVVLGCGFHGLLASEEATGTGPLRLDEDFPCFVKWVRDFRAQAEVEEIIPAHDKWLEHIKGVRQLAVNSIMSWYRALESGKFWFPAQVYNRGKGHPGFMLSCYDAQLSYDCRTHTFTARYPPHGGRTMVIEEGVQWERLRAPPVDTPAHGLHTSDCLNDLRPGDHVEVQWRMNKEVPYGWWYGVIGHLDFCGGNKFHCRCHNSDTVILEFNQYATGSRWRLATINRKDHKEEGNATDGFYGGIRKLYSMEEIATWRRLWPTDILE